MFPSPGKGRVLSEESDIDVRATRTKLTLWVALPILAMIILVAFVNTNGIWVAWVAGFGLLAFLLFLNARLHGPMRVYETGIEYSGFIIRKFYPWNRLMLYSETMEGIELRRVHALEAAMGVLDNRNEVVETVKFSATMPNYSRVKEFIRASVVAANVAQSTKYMWDGRTY